MVPDEYSLFESVIHITEERDKKSLEKALVRTLSDFVDFDALILLRIPRNVNSEYLEVAASSPESIFKEKLSQIPHEYGSPRVQLDEGISQCIGSGELVSDEQNGTQRILFPSMVNDVETGVLDIYGCPQKTNSLKLIRGFIRIYSNFLAILADNEHDTLTGLLNRKTFDAQLAELLSSSKIEANDAAATEDRRSGKDGAYHWVGMLDVDHFKTINDNFGHVYGDEVLLLFANLMGEAFRNNDLLFRYGGEEFVVVLAPATEPDAHLVFERFRQIIEAYDFPGVGSVTVSIGMTKIDAQEHSSAVLEHADQALYYSKENGRNRVCNYNVLVQKGLLTVRQTKNNIEIFNR